MFFIPIIRPKFTFSSYFFVSNHLKSSTPTPSPPIPPHIGGSSDGMGSLSYSQEKHGMGHQGSTNGSDTSTRTTSHPSRDDGDHHGDHHRDNYGDEVSETGSTNQSSKRIPRYMQNTISRSRSHDPDTESVDPVDVIHNTRYIRYTHYTHYTHYIH